MQKSAHECVLFARKIWIVSNQMEKSYGQKTAAAQFESIQTAGISAPNVPTYFCVDLLNFTGCRGPGPGPSPGIHITAWKSFWLHLFLVLKFNLTQRYFSPNIKNLSKCCNTFVFIPQPADRFWPILAGSGNGVMLPYHRKKQSKQI